MEPVKEDKRARRTKARLRQALIQLIVEIPYDDITVQNILDTADVSRSAFYAHFRDKDELLMEGMPTDILSYGLEQNDGLLPSVAPLFAHVLEGKDRFHAMVGNRGMTLLAQKSRERMVENWLEHISRWQPSQVQSTMPPTAIAHYLTGALMSLLLWWVNQKMETSPEEMNQMFQQLAGRGIATLFSVASQ